MITDLLASQIKSYCESNKKVESCGLVVESSSGMFFYPSENVHEKPEDNFMISPEAEIIASTYGNVVAVVHSHVSDSHLKTLSVNDRICQYKDGREWWLYVDGEIKIFPKQRKLKGREFIEGKQDCYDSMKDFYFLCGVDLGEYSQEQGYRIPGWHEREGATSPFIDFFESEGFYSGIKLEDIQPGDVIVSLLGSTVGNHCSVYVGDNEIFHHLPRKLSFIEFLRPYFTRYKDSIWRHKESEKLPIDLVIKILRGE